MRRQLFLAFSMFLLLISATSILQSQVNYPVLQEQHTAQTVQAQSDGKGRCINDRRRPDNVYKDSAHTNCPCWGNANPNDTKYPNCKHEGEDPSCKNACTKTMCDCKSPCQS